MKPESTMENWLKDIQSNYAKAWKYFMIFLDEEIDVKEDIKSDFQELPFEFQFGVYLAFFDSINSDVQLIATDLHVLKESIREAFETYEEYLFLDS